MEGIYIAVEIILVFLLGLFIKNFLPSYKMSFPGCCNLSLLTPSFNNALYTPSINRRLSFKEGFELFSSDVRFKYDFYFKQYSELYSKLYGIIMQSEYVRHFLKINDGQEVSFDEAPFLEVSPTRKVTKSVHWGSERPTEVTQKEERIDTPISDFNKSQLCEYIIENAEYATQKLLKVAVSYRFASYYYSGNPEAKNASCQGTANDEEFRLIREMVCCIVSEYNFFRKELKMAYNEIELETGIPQL